MKIKEAIMKGIRRVHDLKWLEKNSYVLLPELINGKYGSWCKLYSDETQEMMGVETPQKFLLCHLVHGEDSDCEEYKGPLSKLDIE
jgi:hypothetical protein